MPPQIAFQSSLPRSGSTLLSNIVGQNPNFHVTPTSGLLDLLYDDWRAIQETLYLTAIPGMRESIVDGMATPTSDLSEEPGW